MSSPSAVAGSTPRVDPVMLRVWMLVAGSVLVTATLLLTTLRDVPAYLDTVSVPWVALTAAFAFAYSASIQFEVRRQSQTVQLTQLPLVVGLFFTTPTTLVSACAVGLLLSQLPRRRPVVKQGFNLAAATLTTALGATVFYALAPASATIHPQAWPATYAATIVEDVTSAAAVALVIGLVERQWSLRRVMGILQFGLVANLVVSSLALMAVSSLTVELANAGILALAAALLIIAVQAYHRLISRHAALRRLYTFARTLGPVAHSTDDLAPTLDEIRELLHAEQIELCLVGGEAGLTRIVAGESSMMTDVQLDDVQLDPRVAQAMATGHGLLDGSRRRRRGRRDQETADEESIVVPLGSSGQAVGALIAHQRQGHTRGFDREDLALLEAVAGQLATALEKGRLLESLRRAATRDSLTGLANLDAIRAHLTGLLTPDGAGAAGAPGAVVLFVDLDRFQDVNETLGHDAGDRLLVDVAERLTDAAPHESVAARVGSDKFVLVIRGNAGSDVARLAAIGVKSRLDGPVRLTDLSADVRVTVGIARGPDQGSDASVLLRRAETAMTAAKGTTTAIAEWEPAHERGGPRRLAMVTALRHALAEGTLDVHYQPKIELGSGRVTGMEALVRWTHPEFGVVRPDEFVPLAETCGLVGALTTNVLRKALETCRTWHDQGKAVGVAVNLSARSLVDPVLVGQVAALLTATGVQAQFLTLEITESSVMDNPERCIELLRSLRALGVRLSIDDFGTGYSSLTYVKGLPVHEVKVDKSFVDDIAHDQADRAVVRAVVDLSHSLGLTTVAEGVEEPEQALVLEELGLNQVQGYFYARPMPADQASDWLRTRPAARV